jgi:hypothetical protein
MEQKKQRMQELVQLLNEKGILSGNCGDYEQL